MSVGQNVDSDVARPPKVFISYSHDSREHQGRVLSLSNQLRQDGIDSWLDQYEVSPAEGWPLWMQSKVEQADFVLIAFTERYHRCLTRQIEPGVGLGVRWESVLILQEIYEGRSENHKFVALVFEPNDARFIPAILRGSKWFDLSAEDGYQALFRRLLNQPVETAPPLGQLKQDFRLEPLEALTPQPDFFYQKADRLHYPSKGLPSPLILPKGIRALHSNLPPKPFLVGRQAELVRIKKALQEKASVVALIGVPGVGRTSLALGAAHALYQEAVHSLETGPSGEHFNTFIWACASCGATRLSDVFDQMACVLDYECVLHLRDDQKRGELAKILQATRPILIVSSVESDTDPDLIHYLDDLPEGCQAIVVTQDCPLQSAVSVEIGPLEKQYSAQLARSEITTLGHLCLQDAASRWCSAVQQATRGIPMAIQWATCQFLAKCETIHSAVEDLTLPPGTQPVEHFFDKCWQAVPDFCRRLLAAAQAFPDSGSTEAVRCVSGVSQSCTQEGLDLLLKMHLVVTTGGSSQCDLRYRIHPCARRLVARAISGDRDWIKGLQSRFIDYFLALAERNANWENPNTVDAMAQERSNIQEAMDLCRELARHRDFVRLHLATCHMLWARGFWQQSLNNGTTAVMLAENSRAFEDAAWIKLETLGWIEFCRGNFPQARRYYEDAKIIFTDPTRPKGIARSHNYLGRLEAAEGNYDEALRLLWDGLRHSEDDLTTGFLESALGDVYYALERYDDATAHYGAVRNYRERIQDEFRLCSVLCDLGDVSLRMLDVATARNRYKEAFQIAERVGRLEVAARSQEGMGEASLESGDAKSAQSYLEGALTSFEKLGRQRDLLRVKNLLNDIEMQPRKVSREKALVSTPKHMVNALLINSPRDVPGSSKGGSQDLRMPLGLIDISSFLRRRGVSSRILDAEALSLGVAEIIREARNLAPCVVGMNCHSMNRHVVYEIASALRLVLPDALLVVGGAHAALAPELTLSECRDLDVVVTGEGERVMYELCRRPAEVASIPGLCYRKDVLIHRNSPMPRIQNLDILGPPYLEDLPVPTYLKYEEPSLPGLWRRIYVNASRGCRFACSYCTQNPLWLGTMTFRSADSVAHEMSMYMSRYDVNRFYFYDDTITDWPGLRRFCKLAGKLPAAWSCSARIEAMTEELVRNMARGGCREIAFGLESGSGNTLKRINKGWYEQCSREDVASVIRMCSDNKIVPRAHFMLGFPWETREDVSETVKFAVWLKSHSLEDANFFIVKVYPGTQLFKEFRWRATSAEIEESELYDAWAVYDWHGTRNPRVAAKLRRFNDIPRMSMHPYLDSMALRQLARNAYEIFFGDLAVDAVDERLWVGVAWQED